MTLHDILAAAEKATGPDNRLDCEIDIALFTPDSRHASVRMNDAGTKLIYTRHGGGTDTYRSEDHTLNALSRAHATALLRALITSQESNNDR